nr:MAG TPA: hypothetical protein [Crassvirales sp.]
MILIMRREMHNPLYFRKNKYQILKYLILLKFHLIY